MDIGILGTAGIADLALVPAIRASDHDLLAVASRDADRAEATADDWGAPRAYGSYEGLLEDGDLDAVYNPLPNSLHAPWTKRAADAGLDVLCEKPLAVDAAEARELGAYCDRAGVTLMEAFMYRYHPRTERAAAVAASELGEVRSLRATFQFPLRGRPEDIRLSPDLAGGSLMDVGVYAVSTARLFLGEPERALATTTDTRDCGVDTQVAATLEYAEGATAQVTASFDTVDRQRYDLAGTEGHLAAPEAYVPRDDDGVALEYSVGERTVTESFEPVDQYRRELEHFATCVAADRRPRTDAENAAATLAVVDAIRESARTGEAVRIG